VGNLLDDSVVAPRLMAVGGWTCSGSLSRTDAQASDGPGGQPPPCRSRRLSL